MILVGLGSNLGDRLLNLRTALTHIKKNPCITIQAVSPLYHSEALVTEQAPAAWHAFFLNAVIAITSSYSPHELLVQLKMIEAGLGRPVQYEKWSPRVIDLDLLIYDDVKLEDENLTIPHHAFRDRPFVLWPMTDILPDWIDQRTAKTLSQLAKPLGSRFTGNAPFQTKQIPHRLEPPIIMGILNVTPDSFSDGGKFVRINHAFIQAKLLIEQGAEYIDIGAESTRPHAQLISADEEWQRLQPILQIIKEKQHEFLIPPKISLDSRNVTSLQRALTYNLDIINKVDGYGDQATLDLVKNSGKKAIVMHQCSIPACPEVVLSSELSPIEQLYQWFTAQYHFLERSGIDPEQLIFDPGLGFGKTPQQTFAILSELSVLRALNKPILIGHSRKSFFSLFDDLPAAKRDTHTAILSFYLAQRSIDYLRVHDVASSRLAVNIQKHNY